MINVTALLKNVPNYTCNHNIDEIMITSVEKDNREVKKGSLFVCIKGFTVDGHDFAQSAVENGATVIVAEKELDVDIPVVRVSNTDLVLPILANAFFQHPTQRLKLIGVTGTNGKTSVTHLIDEICKKNQQQTGIIGTIEMRINDQVYPVKNTTPDALFLQKSFHQMVTEKVDTAIMEVSSHALDQGRVHGSEFDIAVFTNLTQDHLDYHPTMNHYLFAKSLLFAQLGNHYEVDKNKYAIINMDDKNSEFIIKATAQPVVTYGIEMQADFRAENIVLRANGVSFDMKTPEGIVKINSKLMGLFSVYNMLAASAAAFYSGVTLPLIQEVLAETNGVNGRFQPIENDLGIGVIVDYAHTPDSLQNVLTTIKSFSKAKIYVVVGCGGDRDRTKRPIMASVACQLADQAIFTSDNPRSEDPLAIIKDMEKGLNADNYQVVVDREEAIKEAIHSANEGDVILIAGKGHETYQIIGEEVLDFDDAEIAQRILTNLTRG